MLETLLSINNNRYLWGIAMLLLNLGSKYVFADLGKIHEMLLSNEFVKKIVIFAMFFVATRDIITSFVLAILYVIVVDGLIHEKRKYSFTSLKLPSNDSYSIYLKNIKYLNK